MPEPRVLFVIGQMETGGAERHLARTLPLLRAAGIDVTLFVMRAGGPLVPALRAAGVDVREPGRRWRGVRGVLLAMRDLRALVRGLRPAVVHYFLPEAWILGALATLGTGPHARVMSRRSLNRYQQRRPFAARLERLLHPLLDVALANARAVRDELLAEGLPPARVGLVYGGIEPPVRAPDRAAARARLGLAPDALVLVAVANLNPYKGHADLVAGLGVVAHALPAPWTLLLVGRDDGCRAALEAQARALGIAGAVRFEGLQEDVWPWLDAADIAVLASHEEGFSNALLEAMCAGLPVVATAVGGNAEAVVDGLTGALVPPRAPQALGGAILALASDPVARARAGRAGRERVVTTFSLAACVAAYARLYRGLAAPGPRRPVGVLLGE